MTTHRACTKCGETKPLEDFSPHARGKYGRQSRCKVCCGLANQARYHADIDKAREQSRLRALEYSARNPEKRKEQRAKWIAANPDADKAAKKKWDLANAEQKRETTDTWRRANLPAVNAKGRAWKKANPERMRVYYLRKYGLTHETYAALLAKQGGKCAICRLEMARPCIDHNHETGATRALLCVACNAGLGNFMDAPANLLAAVDYLVLHGAPGMTSE